MRVFELLVHDVSESYDELPSTLITLRKWLTEFSNGKQKFNIDLYEGVGIRMFDGTNHFLIENFGGLKQTLDGCRAMVQRLNEGRVALLRTSTENIGVYLLFSNDDPIRVSIIRELPPGGEDPYPFYPSEKFEAEEKSHILLNWAENEAERLLAPSDNKAYDEARGLLLRLPRENLISDVLAEADLAENVKKEIWNE